MKEINNDIQLSYCSFETSKLLKEKGFTGGIFRDDNNYNYHEGYQIKQFHTWIVYDGKPVRMDIVSNNCTSFGDLRRYYTDISDLLPCEIEWFKLNHMYLAPTHSLAIEWIRVNFGIFLWVEPFKDHAADTNDPIMFRYVIQTKEFKRYSLEYSTSQEAIEIALKHVLEKLI